MSVMVETSMGTFVVDLYTDRCPKACMNFLKLCKAKYYNNHLIFSVERNVWIQTGDPTGTGKGGCSVFGLIGGSSQYFHDEVFKDLTIDRTGLLCMASHGPDLNGSQFFITMTSTDLVHLNGKKTVFGEVAEGMEETLAKMNSVETDEQGRPFRDIRILHTHILHDPFEDPEGFAAKFGENLASPTYYKPPDEAVEERIAFDEDIDQYAGLSQKQVEERMKDTEMESRAVVLEMVGDLPSADIKPPENVLFVCKLNPATQDADLELIFSRFGDVKSCEIIRDKENGASLQYGFVEFATAEQCQAAYFRMNNVVIDDRRIKVDFSQSVSKIWNDFHRRKQQKRKINYISTNNSSSSSSSSSRRSDGDRRDRHEKEESKKKKKKKKKKRM